MKFSHFNEKSVMETSFFVKYDKAKQNFFSNNLNIESQGI